VAGGVLAAIEGSVRLFGAPWRPVHKPESRGFDPAEPYLVKTGDAPDAGHTTHLFDGGEHELQIPPKGARKRVLLMGGSNTRLLPEAFLQELLNASGAPDQYEVINLGRHGYGSERERLLFEQALALEPDVVFLYSGHNEFIEKEYRAKVEGREGEWIRKATETLRDLKTVDLVASEMRRAGKEAVPDASAHSFEQFFAAYTTAQRDAVYDAFRDNLTAICRLGHERGVRVVLGTNVRNMFQAPTISRSDLPKDSEELRSFRELYARGLQAIPSRFTDGVLPGNAISTFDWGLQAGEWWEEFYRPPAEGQDVAPEYPQLRPEVMDAAAALCARWTRAPVAEGALWTPPALWTKRAHQVVSALAAAHAGRPDTDEGAALDAAVADLSRATELAPGHAGARFALALCLLSQGADPARVVRLLDEAADLDWAPLVGNVRINDIVREVARGVEGTELLDADALFRGRTRDGLVDYQVIMDANHLHPGAKLLLLQDLATLVLGRGEGAPLESGTSR
jgi:hypothetical protein